MSLHQSICRALAAYGLDYADLAKLTGLPRQTTHRYLSGKMDLSGQRIDLILAALDLKVIRYKNRQTYKQFKLLLRGRTKKEKRAGQTGLTLVVTHEGEQWLTKPELEAWQKTLVRERDQAERERLHRRRRQFAVRPKKASLNGVADKRATDPANDIFE